MKFLILIISILVFMPFHGFCKTFTSESSHEEKEKAKNSLESFRIKSNLNTNEFHIPHYRNKAGKFNNTEPLKNHKKLFSQEHKPCEDHTIHDILSYWELSKSLKKSEDVTASLNTLQRALITSSCTFNSEDIADNPTPSEVYYRSLVLELLIEKAHLLQLLDKKKNVQHINNCYRAMERLGRKMITESTGERNTLYVSKKMKTIYSTLIESASTIEDKYHYMEKAKGQALKFQLNGEQAQILGQIPKKLIIFEDSLKQYVSIYRTELHNEKDSVRAYTAAIQYFDAQLKLDSLYEHYQDQFPAYYKLKYQNHVMKVEDLQKSTEPFAIRLQYHVSKNKIFIFSASRKKIGWHEIVLDNDLRAAIDSFKNFSTKPSKYLSEDFKEVAHRLYQQLVQPSLNIHDKTDYRKLIIVPDDLLWHMNFDLLITSSISNKSGSEFPYLIKEYAIGYTYSHTISTLLKGRKKKTSKELLAFSYGETDQPIIGDQLSFSTLRSLKEELPGSRQEIKDIAELVEGDYYFGSHASEQQFKKIAKDYKVLHLAMHAELNDMVSDHSKLT